MPKNNDKYNNKNTHLEMNIIRLIGSAIRQVSASTVFKRNLLIQLKQAYIMVFSGQSKAAPGFDENLGKLMASSAETTVALPGFKDHLYSQLTAAQETKEGNNLSAFLIPAFASAAALVILIGFVFPYFWAGGSTGVTATVNQGTAQAIQIKPLFFIWGNKTMQSSVKAGDKLMLAKGDGITTGPDSQAVLTMPNESTVKLFPGSKITINEYARSDTEDSYFVRLKLDSGRATSNINGLYYWLDTPVASSRVIGTWFRTEVISNDQTNLATDEGVVKLTMEGNSVQVAAGEEVKAIRGKPLVVSSQEPPSIIIEKRYSSVYHCDKNVCLMYGPEVSSSPITLNGRTDPGAVVIINNQPVDTDNEGRFSIMINLEPGENQISISASNRVGKTTLLNLFLTLSTKN